MDPEALDPRVSCDRGQHPRVRLLPHERHREADPRGPGLKQGRHARLPEHGDDRRHPESVSAMRDFDLYSIVQCKFAF